MIFDLDTSMPRGRLVGRAEETAVLGGFVRRVSDGLSDALVVLGEAGVGKTSLLHGLSRAFADVRFVVTAGAESEQPLAYAGLQQLLSPFMDRDDLLPVPQRAALRSAFGIESQGPPDRLLIGVAALTLLAGIARERPLICVIDDAQWLDAESLAALGFVGRRIDADSLGLLLTIRANTDREPPTELAGWRALRLAGLDEASSTALLTDRYGSEISRSVMSRLFHGTGGNPLALLTIAASLSKDQRGGHRPLPDPMPVGVHLEKLFAAQVRLLPAATRELLLLAAAGSPGEPAVFWAATSLLSLSSDDLDPAVAAGIVAVGDGVSFRHPLVRSAVYSGASASGRRAVHAALAAATDVDVDPDRRSWHLAAATVGPDEEVAAALERSSERAAERGGFTARAAYLRRAGELSIDPNLRTSRLLGSAQAYYFSGDAGNAQVLLDQLPAAPPKAVQAERDRLQMMLNIARSRPAAVPALILRNIGDAISADPRQTRDILLEALHAVILTGRFGSSEVAVQVAEAALSALSSDSTPMTSADWLLKAFATRMLGDFPATVALLRQGVAQGDLELHTNGITWFSLSNYAHLELWNVRGERELVRGLEDVLRARGALSGLVMVLLQLAGTDVRDGHFDAADARYAEATGILQSLNNPTPELYTTLGLAWRGREQQLRQIAEVANTVYGEPLGIGLVLGLTNYHLLILELSLGRYAQALVQANLLFAEDSPATGSLCLPAMIEAAWRSGDHAAAQMALARLAGRAEAVGNTYVRGLLARSTALVSDDSTAEKHYLSAIGDLTLDGVATDVAWAHLLYGEWLRRQKRRSAARTELETAYEAFEQMGAVLWAERARRELVLTGARVPTSVAAVGEPILTGQEARIAGLAAQGHTNQEIATQLFLGVSTVEYHLTKIFRKHHLTSRRQLRQLLPNLPADSPTPSPEPAPGAQVLG